MPWARVDDNFFHHPKTRKAWRCPRAVGLHMLSLSYCMAHGKEGRLDQEFLEDQIPDAGERDTVVAALVQSGLWDEKPHGWEIHDFLKYNPSNAEQAARKEADRLRKQEERERDG